MGIKESIKQKNKLYKQYMTTKSPFDEQKYLQYKRIYKRILKAAESKQYNQQFDTKTMNIKKIWNNLNTLCSFRKKTKQEFKVNKLTVDRQELSSAQDISNAFNKSVVAEQGGPGRPWPP